MTKLDVARRVTKMYKICSRQLTARSAARTFECPLIVCDRQSALYSSLDLTRPGSDLLVVVRACKSPLAELVRAPIVGLDSALVDGPAGGE